MISVAAAGRTQAGSAAGTSRSTEPILRGRDLRCRLGGRMALDGVSIALAPADICVVLGANGSGKTTLLRLLCGSLSAHSGQVWLHGEEVTRLPLHARARRGVGYLPQGPSVLVGLSAAQNIEAVLEQRRLPRRERESKVQQLLELFGLVSVAQQRAGTLSGGERRRVELARVVALEPQVALLDEPFAGLDPDAVSGLSRLIVGLAARGVAVLLAEHHVQQALTIGRHACILVEGRVVLSGTPETIAGRYGLKDLSTGVIDGPDGS